MHYQHTRQAYPQPMHADQQSIETCQPCQRTTPPHRQTHDAMRAMQRRQQIMQALQHAIPTMQQVIETPQPTTVRCQPPQTNTSTHNPQMPTFNGSAASNDVEQPTSTRKLQQTQSKSNRTPSTSRTNPGTLPTPARHRFKPMYPMRPASQLIGYTTLIDQHQNIIHQWQHLPWTIIEQCQPIKGSMSSFHRFRKCSI